MWWWEGSGPSVSEGGWKLIPIYRQKKKMKAGKLLKYNQALTLANSVGAYQSVKWLFDLKSVWGGSGRWG